MDRVVGMISENTELGEICARISQRKVFYNKKVEDYRSLLSDANKQMHVDNNLDIEILVNWLRAEGRLPEDYSKSLYGVNIHTSNNAISIFKKDTPNDSDYFAGPVPEGSQVITPMSFPDFMKSIGNPQLAMRNMLKESNPKPSLYKRFLNFFKRK